MTGPATGSRMPPESFDTVAVVPAAGVGLRMGGTVRKQFLPVAGLPLLVHSLRVFQSSPVIDAEGSDVAGSGEPRRIRTFNLGIKSPLLYR